ncbi:MAG: helix-turn-helix transcriptional regulator [Peptococcaceae bacterium]|nr:helix-turn-helix transcriptional regulator [Peptococcaceae bacterium]
MAEVNVERVQQFRESKGLSEGQLAVRMGVARSYVFRVFRGSRKPGGKFIQGLVQAGMNPTDIFLSSTLPVDNKGVLETGNANTEGRS